MENKLNSAVAELLKQAAPAPAPVAPQEEADPEPGPFVFNTVKDKNGLYLESSSYVNKKCRICYGRGYQTFLIGDGYKTTLDGQRVPRRARNLRTCICVHKGYKTTRLVFESTRDALVKAGNTPEKAAEMALVGLVPRTEPVEIPLPPHGNV